jgi:hypothetical protein
VFQIERIHGRENAFFQFGQIVLAIGGCRIITDPSLFTQKTTNNIVEKQLPMVCKKQHNRKKYKKQTGQNHV